MITTPQTIWEKVYHWLDYHHITADMISQVIVHSAYDMTNKNYHHCLRYGVSIELAKRFHAVVGRGGVGFTEDR